MTPGRFEFNVWRRKTCVAGSLLLALGLAFAQSASAAVTSQFDTDVDGWEGISCPNPGLVCGTTQLGPGEFSWEATGGSSGSDPAGPQVDGYIKSTDPGSNDAARMFAPAKFNDALALNKRLTFDLVIIPDPNGGTTIDQIPPPIVAIEGAGRLLVYLGATPGINSWSDYDVLLNNTGNAFGTEDSWVGFVGAAGPGPVAESDFLAVFADPLARLSFTGEFINDGMGLFDSVGLDNVNLVPLPAALPLLAGALLGLGFTRRKARA